MRIVKCASQRRRDTLLSLKSSANLLPVSDQSSPSSRAYAERLRIKAAALPSLAAWLNTVTSSTAGESEMVHEHSVAARLIALEEDKAEMLELFQRIYDSISEGMNPFQAKSLAYVALQRYGPK